MNHDSRFQDRVLEVFQPTPRGVVGLVEDLIELSRGHGLRLDFRDDHCHVRPFEASPQGSIDLPVPKSVIRAVIARVAAFCNEGAPGAVSPYHGVGELSARTDPPATFRVAFTNTPAVQRLEVNPVRGVTGAFRGDRWESRESASPA